MLTALSNHINALSISSPQVIVMACMEFEMGKVSRFLVDLKIKEREGGKLVTELSLIVPT